MNFRKIFLTILLTALFAVPQVFAQLTGAKTIPGDYATIALAIADLNTAGCRRRRCNF